MFSDYYVGPKMWNYFEIVLIFERVHYCCDSAVTKTGYDEGIPWKSRKYSIFYI